MVTSMADDDLRYFIADPHVMYCTDGELNGKHPRGAGSFPRILGKYVREEKLLPLELAIHKMTLKPASRLGLTDRGQIAPGKIADLVHLRSCDSHRRSNGQRSLSAAEGNCCGDGQRRVGGERQRRHLSSTGEGAKASLRIPETQRDRSSAFLVFAQPLQPLAQPLLTASC